MRLRERIFQESYGKILLYSHMQIVHLMLRERIHRSVVGWKELGLQNSYTMEASFCGADFGRRAERHLTIRRWDIIFVIQF